MQRVVNHKAKIAFKLDEACLLEAQPGDRLVLDRVSEHGYVAYVVPRARFLKDFEPVGDDAGIGGEEGFRLRDAAP